MQQGWGGVSVQVLSTVDWEEHSGGCTWLHRENKAKCYSPLNNCMGSEGYSAGHLSAMKGGTHSVARVVQVLPFCNAGAVSILAGCSNQLLLTPPLQSPLRVDR